MPTSALLPLSELPEPASRKRDAVLGSGVHGGPMNEDSGGWAVLESVSRGGVQFVAAKPLLGVMCRSRLAASGRGSQRMRRSDAFAPLDEPTSGLIRSAPDETTRVSGESLECASATSSRPLSRVGACLWPGVSVPSANLEACAATARCDAG